MVYMIVQPFAVPKPPPPSTPPAATTLTCTQRQNVSVKIVQPTILTLTCGAKHSCPSVEAGQTATPALPMPSARRCAPSAWTVVDRCGSPHPPLDLWGAAQPRPSTKCVYPPRNRLHPKHRRLLLCTRVETADCDNAARACITVRWWAATRRCRSGADHAS